MEEVFRFLNTYQLWIYLILGAATLLSLRNVLIAWQERQISIFGLERESAQRRMTEAGSVLIFLCLLMAAEFLVASIVYPDMPNTSALATPTIALTNEGELAAAGTESSALPLETPEGTPTIAVSDDENGCIPGQIEWLDPLNAETETQITDSTLRGQVILRGTVTLANLGFYKYEYNTAGTDIWTPIAAGTSSIFEGPLGGEGSGVWDTSQLEPGDYRLRLVVVDNVNNVYPPCVISVRIAAP
jgi:hypothetical protein